jgi:hypothetical protein
LNYIEEKFGEEEKWRLENKLLMGGIWVK